MKTITKIKQSQKGISMMELLVYMAILMLITGVLVRVMAGTFAVYARTRAIRALNTTGSAIVERISYNVRNASSFSSTGNSFSVNPSSVSLEVVDSNDVNHTYAYTLDQNENRLQENIDGAGAEYMHGPGQNVTNFTISQISAGTQQGIIIEMTLVDDRVSPVETATFRTSVLMRGSY